MTHLLSSSSSKGAELCTIVETMYSFETMVTISSHFSDSLLFSLSLLVFLFVFSLTCPDRFLCLVMRVGQIGWNVSRSMLFLVREREKREREKREREPHERRRERRREIREKEQNVLVSLLPGAIDAEMWSHVYISQVLLSHLFFVAVVLFSTL
jgi:hypothetical protein